LLARLLRREAVDRTLVFTRTKYGADKLVKTLRRSGIAAEAIHGNKTQNARTRALHDFKSGRTPVLVATDIASRGIDIDEITHVVNFDMPNIAETYIHRIGRTARAGASGIAVSFCDREELEHLRAIERLIGRRLDVDGNESDLVFDMPTAQPERNGHRSPMSPSYGVRRRKRGSSGAGHSRQAASGPSRRPRTSRGSGRARNVVAASRSSHCPR